MCVHTRTAPVHCCFALTLSSSHPITHRDPKNGEKKLANRPHEWTCIYYEFAACILSVCVSQDLGCDLYNGVEHPPCPSTLHLFERVLRSGSETGCLLALITEGALFVLSNYVPTSRRKTNVKVTLLHVGNYWCSEFRCPEQKNVDDGIKCPFIFF